MEIKEATDILGNKIAKSPLSKLLKKAKKVSNHTAAKKRSKK